MSDIFEEVRASVTMPFVVSYYGFHPNKAGFICCPFHSEKTASLKVYSDSFHCYGCGASGSVIDFVMKLFGLSSIEAARKINEDLRLNIAEGPGAPLQKAREIKDLFDPYVEDLKAELCAIIYAANMIELFDDITDSEAKILRYREIAAHKLDALNSGSLEDMISIVKGREEVEALCSEITESMQLR